MKKILSLLVLTALVVAGCNKYDDSDLQRRVAALETSMNQLIGYKDLLAKLDAGKTVTAFSQSGNEITLTFSDGKTITFNQKGDKGDPGESIQGNPGTPGVSPQVKIEGESWMVSYDEGKTWTNIGSAIDRSLIKDIELSDDGKTLLITLADGTVVPVAFGEKEGYDLDIAGGRKYFSVLEKREFYWGPDPSINKVYYDVPYTLSGEIETIEDVQFSVRASTSSDQVNPYGLVTVIPTDEKTGVIRVMQTPVCDNDYTFGYSADGFFWIDWPEMDVEVVAYFPDHTSAFKSFKVLPMEIGMQVHDDYSGDFAFEYENNYPVMWLPKEAGTIALKMWISIYKDFGKYDGNEFPAPQFTLPLVSTISRPFSYDFFIPPKSPAFVETISLEDYWERTYEMTFDYEENTQGMERYNDCVVLKVTGPQVMENRYRLFTVRFKQPK
jgi:hypothetical protein